MQSAFTSIDAGNHDIALLAIAALFIGATVISTVRRRMGAR